MNEDFEVDPVAHDEVPDEVLLAELEAAAPQQPRAVNNSNNRTHYDDYEVELLLAICYEKKPWEAVHGKVKAMWDEIKMLYATRLQELDYPESEKKRKIANAKQAGYQAVQKRFDVIMAHFKDCLEDTDSSSAFAELSIRVGSRVTGELAQEV
jgi:hypothetical protein